MGLEIDEGGGREKKFLGGVVGSPVVITLLDGEEVLTNESPDRSVSGVAGDYGIEA